MVIESLEQNFLVSEFPDILLVVFREFLVFSIPVPPLVNLFYLRGLLRFLEFSAGRKEKKKTYTSCHLANPPSST